MKCRWCGRECRYRYYGNNRGSSLGTGYECPVHGYQYDAATKDEAEWIYDEYMD